MFSKSPASVGENNSRQCHFSVYLGGQIPNHCYFSKKKNCFFLFKGSLIKAFLTLKLLLLFTWLALPVLTCILPPDGFCWRLISKERPPMMQQSSGFEAVFFMRNEFSLMLLLPPLLMKVAYMHCRNHRKCRKV